MNAGSTPHLTWAELACEDGTPYPARFIRDGSVTRSGAVFEAIRYKRKYGGLVQTALARWVTVSACAQRFTPLPPLDGAVAELPGGERGRDHAAAGRP